MSVMHLYKSIQSKVPAVKEFVVHILRTKELFYLGHLSRWNNVKFAMAGAVQSVSEYVLCFFSKLAKMSINNKVGTD